MRPSEAWKLHRDTIARLVNEHHGINPRVFGSTVRGEDTYASDFDLLIDPTDRTTLHDLVELVSNATEIEICAK
jgi:predicted nucleotidyltransferase